MMVTLGRKTMIMTLDRKNNRWDAENSHHDIVGKYTRSSLAGLGATGGCVVSHRNIELVPHEFSILG